MNQGKGINNCFFHFSDCVEEFNGSCQTSTPVAIKLSVSPLAFFHVFTPMYLARMSILVTADFVIRLCCELIYN